MFCPYCQSTETKVIDSRLVAEGTQVRRRRQCLLCKERFTTFETACLELPRVIKRDGKRTAFNIDKLRTGLLKALEKRPVDIGRVDQAVYHIIRKLRAVGEREVTSYFIGELVMEELRLVDEVAYVRFASVYRCFQDVNAFNKEIEHLKNQHKKV